MTAPMTDARQPSNGLAAPEQAPPVAMGYASPDYARALAGGALVWPLRHSGGQLLLRGVGSGERRDATGCYPLFSCLRPEALSRDLAELPDDVVAVSLVPDPLLGLDGPGLGQLFDVVRLLSEHYVVDLAEPTRGVARHHRRELRRAAAHPIEIRVESDAPGFLERWLPLYDHLVARHGIQGPRRFSRDVFSAMLSVPGTVVLSAWEGDLLLGADWYLREGDRVHAHLSAYAPEGYARSVSYPLMEAAIAHFEGSASLLALGGTPTRGADGSGMARFKQGWATGTVPAYLCGSVLDQVAYDELCRELPGADAAYFPAYRGGEFG